MAREIGTVCVDKRAGRNQWYVLVHVLFPTQRTRRRLRIYSSPLGAIRSRRQAQEVLESIRAQVANGKSLAQAVAPYLGLKAPENSVRRNWERFVAAKERLGQGARRIGGRRRLSTGRLRELESYWRRGYFKPFEGMGIHEVTTGTLEDWLGWMDQQFSHLQPKTVRNVVGDIGTFLRWLKRRGDLQELPELPEVPVDDYVPQIPSPETLERILGEIPWRKRGLFLLRSYLGLRPSEARRLRRRHYRDQVLTVEVTKTGKARKLRVEDPRVRAWLEEFAPWDPLQGSAPLCPNPDAYNEQGEWSYASERRTWIAACKAAGVPRMRPNEGGRHAFATHAMSLGADIYRLKDWMGHREIRTTERYIELTALGDVRALRPRSEPTGGGNVNPRDRKD